MAKGGDMIIAGCECEGCVYLVDTTDVNHKIICRARDKQYYYGSYIPCDDRKEDK